MPSGPNKELLKALAERQCGHFTASQALKCGFSHQLHRYYCGKGEWRRLGNGLFALPGFPESHKAKLVRLSLWSRDQDDHIQAVISHESALYHHGLLDAEPENLHFSVNCQFRKKLPEGCERHLQALSPADFGDFGCLKVTIPERSLQDCRASLEAGGFWPATLRKALDAGLCDPDFARRNHWLDAAELARPAPRLAKGHVYFFTCGDPHYHLPLMYAVSKALRRHGLFLVSVPSASQDESRPALQEVLRANPAGIVVDTNECQFPFDLMAGSLDTVKTVVLNHTPKALVNADFVNIDFRLGAYEAMRHLLGQGHERTLLLQPGGNDEFSPAASFMYTSEYQLREGYLEALREAGLAGCGMTFEELPDEADNQARLAEILAGPGRPTAILASQDSRLAVKFGLFARLGLAVPGDLALVGFYDTPWCQATATPLSSVKIDLDKMADAVVSRLLLPPGEGHTTLVHPELVARASSTK